MDGERNVAVETLVHPGASMPMDPVGTSAECVRSALRCERTPLNRGVWAGFTGPGPQVQTGLG